MSKSRNHSSELEQLRQEVRNLKSENRNLRKQLTRASKSLHRLEDLEELVLDEGMTEEPSVSIETGCNECKGLPTKMGGKTRMLHQADCSQRKRK